MISRITGNKYTRLSKSRLPCHPETEGTKKRQTEEKVGNIIKNSINKTKRKDSLQVVNKETSISNFHLVYPMCHTSTLRK